MFSIRTMNSVPTLEEFFKYIENLVDCVERQLLEISNNDTRCTLLRLKALLKANHIKDLIDGLSSQRVNITAFHKIREMDDLLDELYLKDLKLPYPNEYLLRESRKKVREQQITILILIFGLMGFELVSE